MNDLEIILLAPGIISMMMAMNFGNNYLELYKKKKNISATTNPISALMDPVGFYTKGLPLEFFILRNIYKKHSDSDLDKLRKRFLYFITTAFLSFIAGGLILMFSV